MKKELNEKNSFLFFQFWPSESPCHPLKVKNCIYHANSSLYYFHTYFQYKVIQVQYIRYISVFFNLQFCYFFVIFIFVSKNRQFIKNFQIRVRTWDQTVVLISRYQLWYLKVQNVIKWINKKRLSKNCLSKKNKLYVERTPQTCHHLVHDCTKYVEVGKNVWNVWNFFDKFSKSMKSFSSSTLFTHSCWHFSCFGRKTRNATNFNNHNDLLHPGFVLIIALFAEISLKSSGPSMI